MADVDIATLGIKVDASTADTAKGSLDGLTNSAERTEAAVKGAGAGTDAMRAAIMAAIGAINANTGAVDALSSRYNSLRGSAGNAGAATDSLDAQVNKLRSSCDPLGQAIERVNQELTQNNALLAQGAIQAGEHARNQTILTGRLNDFQNRQAGMNGLMAGGARSAKLQAHEMLNLSRQFADIGVTAAMGMNPLMILIQQGPQIADVFQTASSRGIGFTQVLRQMAAPVIRFLPLIGAIGGVTAVAFAGLGLAARAMEKDVDTSFKGVQAQFGFTEKQMERLKDKGTDLGFTMGDVMAGLGFAIKGAITDAWGEELDAMEKWWNQTLDYVTKELLNAVDIIGGDFTGMFYAIKELWTSLPAVMRDVGIQAANALITAINFMVQKTADGINFLIQSIPEILRPNITVQANKMDLMGNPDSGAAAGLGNKMGDAFGRGQATFRRERKRFTDRMGEGMEDSREERLREDAGDAEKGRKPRKAAKPKVSDEQKDWERELKSAQEFTKAMKEQTAEIGKTAFEVKMLHTERKSAELEAAALALGTADAHAQAHAEILKMRDATEQWIMATNAEKIKEMKRELSQQSNEIAFERTLLSMNNEERLKAIKLREINTQIMEAERLGYKGVAAALREEAEALVNEAGKTGAMQDKIKAANDATEAMRQMNDGIREATESFGELFGTAGEGFANLLNVMLDYNEQYAESQNRIFEIQSQYREGEQMSQADAEETARIRAGQAQAQIAHYGNMLSAAKGFFKEGSTGWKILEGAERVYRLFQFAMAIRAMFMDKAQTVSSVANSGARAAADGVAAVAKAIASLPFPLNLVAGAATLAFLVGIGVKMFGGGGKGGGGGGGASKEAEKQTEKYNGPRDEYGAPTSYYSVLKPGATTVAGSGGYGASMGAPAASAGQVSVKGGDINLTINGGADRRTMQEQILPMLEQHRQATVQDARQAVSQDMATKGSRQQIGGGWG